MMKRFLLVAVVGISIAGCGAGRKSQWETAKPGSAATTGQTPDALIAEGDAAWANRGDMAQVEAAIAAWKKAAEIAPEDAKIHTRISRGYFFLADAHHRKEGEQSEKYLSTFEKGTAAGERAIAAASPEFKKDVTGGSKVEDAVKKIGPEGIEPLYWYASNLGKWAKAKGLPAQLGNKDKIKAAMDQVMKLDENFFHAAPHRYFGAFYAVAPGFAGGDMDKSKKQFEKAIEMAPNYVGTKVLYAETYAKKKKDRALFDKLLAEVLATPDDVLPDLIPETKNEKEKAKELQAQADKLF